MALPLLVWGAGVALPSLSTCITAIAFGTVAGAAAYSGYKLYERGYISGQNAQFIDSLSTGYAHPNPQMGYILNNILNDLNMRDFERMQKKQLDEKLPKNPDELLNDSDWKEVSHPDAKAKGHRTFENKKTGEQYRHDQGRLGETGHAANDHWHHLRPDGKGGFEYLDGKGNPVPKGHDNAHIYPEETF